MNKKCPDCKSKDVTEYTPGIFGDSRHRCNSCGTISATADFVEPTVFQKITSSPEVLAPTMVWEDYDWCVFRSNIIEGGEFDTRKDAIDATVKKLKEVVKDNIHEMEVEKLRDCESCHGTGYLKSRCDEPDRICPICHGTGRDD